MPAADTEHTSLKQTLLAVCLQPPTAIASPAGKSETSTVPLAKLCCLSARQLNIQRVHFCM